MIYNLFTIVKYKRKIRLRVFRLKKNEKRIEYNYFKIIGI